MSEQPDGGDISSGFGESKVTGPVSDQKAEKMLHDDRSDSDSDGDSGSDSDGKDTDGEHSEQDVANNEQDLSRDD